MKAKVKFSQEIIPEIVNLNYVLKNEGVYSLIEQPDDRVVTFRLGDLFSTIYVYENGEIEPLELPSYDGEDFFHKLNEEITISFEKFEEN